jgi:hypothetical protein
MGTYLWESKSQLTCLLGTSKLSEDPRCSDRLNLTPRIATFCQAIELNLRLTFDDSKCLFAESVAKQLMAKNELLWSGYLKEDEASFCLIRFVISLTGNSKTEDEH